MAIAFGAAGTSGTNTTSPATCTAPARAVGDLILVQVMDSGTGATIATPTGWTLVEGPVSATTHRAWVYARICDNTATDNFSAVITGPTVWLADCWTYTGVDTSGAILTTAIVAHRNDTAAAALTLTSGTVTSPGSPSGCVLAVAMSEDSVNTAHTFTMGAAAPALGTGTIRMQVNEANQKQDMASGDWPTTMTPSTGYTATVNISASEVIALITFILAPAGTATSTWTPTQATSPRRTWRLTRRPGINATSDFFSIIVPVLPRPTRRPRTWRLMPPVARNSWQVFADTTPTPPPNAASVFQRLRNDLRRWGWVRRGERSEPPWGQAAAPVVPYIDVFRRTSRRLLAVRRRVAASVPLDPGTPVVNVARRLRATWRQMRPKLYHYVRFQQPPNSWQHPSTWRVFSRRTWTWRRARMHDEPALMAQQAAVPNPDVVSTVQRWRNSLRSWRVTRRGRFWEPPWGQATAAVAPAFVDWWRRVRGYRSTFNVRRRSRLVPETPDLQQANVVRRRKLGWIRRLRRVDPAFGQTAPPVNPPFVAWFARLPRAWRRTRRGRYYSIEWAAVASPVQYILLTILSRSRLAVAQARDRIAVSQGKSLVVSRSRALVKNSWARILSTVTRDNNRTAGGR